MEGFLIQRWTPNLPGAAGGSTNLSQSAINQWGWVCTPCETVLPQRITVVVPGLLGSWMYGRVDDSEVGPYPPRVLLAL